MIWSLRIKELRVGEFFTLFYKKLLSMAMSSSHNQIIKDAFWQILGRVFSALWGFVTIKLITPYLWPLRYGDYNTILKYFAIWSALADLGLYTIALRELWKIKHESWEIVSEGDMLSWVPSELEWNTTYHKNASLSPQWQQKLNAYYSKFMWSRIINLVIVYTLALIVAYLIPSYSSNPFIVWWLPLGMIFSATFVLGYFFQLPHQLFRSMQHTSISLIIARVWQILLLSIILFVFPSHEITNPTFQNIIIFCLILFTVVASGVFQIWYQRLTGRKFMKLSLDLDWWFFRRHVIDNRRYGVWYFMSSFHTLAVWLLLSWIYPTKDGFVFVGVWWLAMTLVEILLIIPSSLWNSVLHKIAHKTIEEKKRSLGGLLCVVWILWWLIALNFRWFNTIIIELVSGSRYLTETLGSWWADSILAWLGIALLLTFTKQSLNYMLIATDHQNKLFWVNTWWVIIGIGTAIWLVYYYGLIWWIIGQLWVELLYVIGGVRVVWKYQIIPSISWRSVWIIVWRALFGFALIYGITYRLPFGSSMMVDLLFITLFNTIMAGLIYKTAKRLMRVI
jgi:O-antigen/teichoic acid export membrane protein